MNRHKSENALGYHARLLNTRTAGYYLGLPKDLILQLRRKGHLAATTIPGRKRTLRFSIDELDRFIRENTNATSDFNLGS